MSIVLAPNNDKILLLVSEKYICMQFLTFPKSTSQFYRWKQIFFDGSQIQVLSWNVSPQYTMGTPASMTSTGSGILPKVSTGCDYPQIALNFWRKAANKNVQLYVLSTNIFPFPSLLSPITFSLAVICHLCLPFSSLSCIWDSHQWFILCSLFLFF